MSDPLEPELLRCFFDGGFSPALPAMHLRWATAPCRASRVWQLPEGLRIHGPAPEFFGITIQRLWTDSYHVCLLWDSTRCCWPNLSRSAILDTSLGFFLVSIGTDLDYLLNQPIIAASPNLVRRAA